MVIAFLIIFIIAFGFILFTFIMVFNPKLQAKFMSRQVKAHKYMVDESKEDLKNISDNLAYASRDSFKTVAGSIKEGLTEENAYCKHCGSLIDGDSVFCKKCGKSQ